MKNKSREQSTYKVKQTTYKLSTLQNKSLKSLFFSSFLINHFFGPKDKITLLPFWQKKAGFQDVCSMTLKKSNKSDQGQIITRPHAEKCVFQDAGSLKLKKSNKSDQGHIISRPPLRFQNHGWIFKKTHPGFWNRNGPRGTVVRTDLGIEPGSSVARPTTLRKEIRKKNSRNASQRTNTEDIWIENGKVPGIFWNKCGRK